MRYATRHMRFAGPLAVGALLAALITCAMASAITLIGFGIDRGAHWDTILQGSSSTALSDVTRALPAKAACGSRWLVIQPRLNQMSDLERQDRLPEAAAICQRAAQQMLGCVPTSSVYGECFRINKEIAVQECRATCNEAMCRAAKMSCDQ